MCDIGKTRVYYIAAMVLVVHGYNSCLQMTQGTTPLSTDTSESLKISLNS